MYDYLGCTGSGFPSYTEYIFTDICEYNKKTRRTLYLPYLVMRCRRSITRCHCISVKTELECVQKRALAIIFSGKDYSDALVSTKLASIERYNENTCKKTFNSILNDKSNRLKKSFSLSQ